MKILFFIISISLFVFNNSYAEELVDCTQLNKFSIKFLDCKAKKLKSKLNEKQSSTKNKISKLGNKLKPKVDNVLKKNDN